MPLERHAVKDYFSRVRELEFAALHFSAPPVAGESKRD